MDIYRENLIDHYNHPRNFGEIPASDTTAELENVSCGDRIKIQIIIEHDTISDIKFSGEGCAVAIASGSILTEHMLGKVVKYANKFTYKELEGLLGVELSPSRMKCANLSLEALKKSLKALTEKTN